MSTALDLMHTLVAALKAEGHALADKAQHIHDLLVADATNLEADAKADVQQVAADAGPVVAEAEADAKNLAAEAAQDVKDIATA